MTLPAPRRGRFLLIVNTVAALALAGLAQAQQPGSGSAPPATGTATAPAAAGAPKTAGPAAAAKSTAGQKLAASYSLGVSMGEQLHMSGVGSDGVSAERLTQGVRDGLSGKAKITDEDRQRITEFIRTAHDAAAENNHRAAARFLAENTKKPDVVTTASGLQYKVLTPGSGESPKATDQVTVNYRGTLLDGSEFDSSYTHGQPATFQVNRVIPGWTEALQLMKPGEKVQLYIPPQLAYDLRSPPSIPPGSLLQFEVELLSVKPAPPAPPLPGPGSAPLGAAPATPPAGK